MRHFDLCIIGSGSGNTIVDEQFADWDVALVDKGVGPDDVFGGTCLNVGCIPTKMFVLPADSARAPVEAARLGVDLTFDRARWPDVRDRIFGRIDSISAGGEKYRAGADNITLYRREAHFVGPRTLDVGDGEQITADRFVLATGSRATLPPVEGLDDVTVHTSDTVMRVDTLPASMVIIGAGYIAAEFAHVFSAFGTKVTVLSRSGGMLNNEDEDVSARFAELMGEQIDLREKVEAERVEQKPDGTVVVHTSDGNRLEAEILLVATGRTPNSDLLGLDRTGVAVADHGYIEVDEHQRVRGADGVVDGFWALGDVDSPAQLKHVANREARVVKHNLLHPEDLISCDRRFIPHAVFSDPQVASVGLTEAQAREQGIDVAVVTQDYGSVAYGWALEDERHFVKLLADRATKQLVGAHFIGPQASTLVQVAIQAMVFATAVPELARQPYWIHPALPEVIENALLGLDL